MDVEFVKYKYEDGYDGVITKKKFQFGVRHIQMVYMILSTLVMGMMRGSTSVALLAVADPTRSNDTYIQIHNWNRQVQGSILSSFFLGYAVALVPAELFLPHIGDKLILTAVFLINGGISAAMPTIINKGGWVQACNAHLLLGNTQACVLPINYKLMSNWLLPCEKKTFSYYVHTALHLGTIIAMPVSGVLSESKLGWELIYYSQAMLTLSMATIWVLLTASTPDRHEAVGDSEKEMIREALASYNQKKLSIPYKQIIKSWKFWALASAHSAANVIFIFYLSELPAFLQTINTSLRTVTEQAVLPLVAMWLVYTATAPVSEYIHRISRYGIFEITHFRKIINGTGALGIIIALAVLPHLIPNWPQLALTVLSGVLGLIGFQFSGFLENHRDMTENFAGTLLMMTSVVAGIIGSAVPYFTGLKIGNNVSPSSWDSIFLMLAFFYFTCNLFYVFFSSSDRQHWDTLSMPKTGYSNEAAYLELDELSKPKINHDIQTDVAV